MSKEQEFLSYEDFQRFIDAIPKYHSTKTKKKLSLSVEQMKLLYKLMFYCALKQEEVLNLQKEDFNLENQTLTIKNTQSKMKQTTIPSIIKDEINRYVETLPTGSKLFNIIRQSIWTWSISIAKLAGLTIFKTTKNKEIKNMHALVFRRSYQEFMIKTSGNLKLSQLKLRISTPEELGITVDELKNWESRLEFLPTYAAVIVGDVLGTKGIWKEKDPSEVISNWSWLVDRAIEYLESSFKDTSFSIKAFSDTLIIIAKNHDIEELILDVGIFLNKLVDVCLVYEFPLRGVFSVGDIVDSDKMIIGPAIDEAAVHYENPDWVGFSATPSSFAILEKISVNPKYQDKVKKYFVKYDVPMKNGVDKNNWAVILDHDLKIDGQFEKASEFLGKTIEEIVYYNLEHPKGSEGGRKWKNTLLFLQYLKNKN